MTSLYLIVFGLAIITLDLIRHPEEWKNWLIRLGIMLVFIVILLFAVKIIRFLKDRRTEN